MHSTLDLSELDTKIGRLFVIGIPGIQLDENTEAIIRRYCLGGVIFFDRNIENPLQLATLCNDLQDKALKYHGIPLFLAIDQEGGPVTRLKKPFTQFPGNSAIGEDPRPEDRAKEFAHITAREMTLVGLNMDMAPVLDVVRGKPERHLAGRSLGDNPEKVAQLGRSIIKILQEKGVMAVAKHFPGLGMTSVDPHHHLPTIEVDTKEMEKRNLPPFRAAIEEGVSAIMTSHAIYPAIEQDFPATLSQKILRGILRERLGFKGLIITDDLEMGAIEKEWGVAQGAVMSFKAGTDILLICHNQDMVLESIKTLRRGLIRGEIPFLRLQQSVDRIMKAKSRFLKKTKRVSHEDINAYFGRALTRR